MKKWQITYKGNGPFDDVEAEDCELGQFWAKLYNGTSNLVWAAPIETVRSIKTVAEVPAAQADEQPVPAG